MDRSHMLEGLTDLILAVNRSHPVRVAVDGMVAAGKTMLADELARLIRGRGRDVIRASVDGFHRPRADRYQRGTDSAEGYFWDAFDYGAIQRVLLQPLGPGGSRSYRLTTFNLHCDAAVDEMPRNARPDAVLLCDGVFLLRPELNGCWDYRVFVRVAERTAVERASGRDRQLFGTGDAARARYWTRYVPAHRIYLDRVAPEDQADVIVDNNDLMSPVLLRQTAGPYS